MSSLQIAVTVFSILYIFFATNNKAICFLFGAIASACWAYESFYNLNLKFDALLQIYYVGISIYGAYHWLKSNGETEKGIKNLSIKENVSIVVVGIIISFACAKVALLYFDTNYAYIDSLTTGFSIIATYLLAQRYLDNWVYWMFINPVYMYIYYKSGATFFVAISLLYTVMAIKGYMSWNKERKEDSINYQS